MVKPAGPARYFVIIGVHSGYAVVVLGAVLVVGLGTVWLDPRELDSALGMILFAQMFLASSGFVAAARQGHFDPLLTGPYGRGAIVAAHCAVSVAPGVIAWLLMTAAAALAGSAMAAGAVAGARAAALFIVSTIAWGLGFGLPRGAAGMLWLALLIGLVMQRAELLAAPAGAHPGASAALHAGTLLVCPFLLLGRHPVLAAGALPAALLLPVVLLLCVWRWARTLDVYLVDRS